MLADIDLLPVGELGLHRLGQDGGGAEPADKLQPRLAALIDATLVSDDGDEDVAIPASNGAATVDIGKHLREVRDPGPSPARSRGDLTSSQPALFSPLTLSSLKPAFWRDWIALSPLPGHASLYRRRASMRVGEGL